MKLKFLIYYLTILFTFSCTLNPSITTNGVINLDEKHKKIIIGTTNRNDVKILLGDTILKEYKNENIWIYFETQEKKNFFGNKEVLKNNLLILEFKNEGIVINKTLFTKDDTKKINFDELKTSSLAINESISKKMLSSIRKRFQSIQNVDKNN